MADSQSELSRRRDREARIERWQIWFDGVQVGSIGQRSGVPKHVPQWEWSCGFYPGSDTCEHRGGIADCYETARAAFGRAWAEFLHKCSDADFDAWRHQAAWTAEKYARWDRGDRTAPPWPLPGFQSQAPKTDNEPRQ
jgi:hypothetical protein